MQKCIVHLLSYLKRFSRLSCNEPPIGRQPSFESSNVETRIHPITERHLLLLASQTRIFIGRSHDSPSDFSGRYGVSMFRVYDITDNLGLFSTPIGHHPCQGSYKTLNLPTHPEHRAGIQAYQSLWLV